MNFLFRNFSAAVTSRGSSFQRFYERRSVLGLIHPLVYQEFTYWIFRGARGKIYCRRCTLHRVTIKLWIYSQNSYLFCVHYLISEWKIVCFMREIPTDQSLDEWTTIQSEAANFFSNFHWLSKAWKSFRARFNIYQEVYGTLSIIEAPRPKLITPQTAALYWK